MQLIASGNLPRPFSLKDGGYPLAWASPLFLQEWWPGDGTSFVVQISTQGTRRCQEEHSTLGLDINCSHVFNSTQCLTMFHHLELMPTFEKTCKKKWDETEEWLEKYWLFWIRRPPGTQRISKNPGLKWTIPMSRKVTINITTWRKLQGVFLTRYWTHAPYVSCIGTWILYH